MHPAYEGTIQAGPNRRPGPAWPSSGTGGAGSALTVGLVCFLVIGYQGCRPLPQQRFERSPGLVAVTFIAFRSVDSHQPNLNWRTVIKNHFDGVTVEHERNLCALALRVCCSCCGVAPRGGIGRG